MKNIKTVGDLIDALSVHDKSLPLEFNVIEQRGQKRKVIMNNDTQIIEVRTHDYKPLNVMFLLLEDTK